MLTDEIRISAVLILKKTKRASFKGANEERVDKIINSCELF